MIRKIWMMPAKLIAMPKINAKPNWAHAKQRWRRVVRPCAPAARKPAPNTKNSCNKSLLVLMPNNLKMVEARDQVKESNTTAIKRHRILASQEARTEDLETELYENALQ